MTEQNIRRKRDMRSFLRILFRIHHFLKRRYFPQFRLNSFVPFWDAVYRRLKVQARSDCIEVLGHTMYLDDQDSLELSINLVHEAFETQTITNLLKEGGVVLDIGANIGYHTLQFARKVGPKGHVYAFEPDIENFKLLCKNVKANGYTNVTALRKAVSNHTGKIKLYHSETNRGDHRVFQSEEEVRRSSEIDSIRLSDYFADLSVSIDLIKMDIQGAEYQALLGMRELLIQNPSATLVMEFWPWGLQKSGATPHACLNVLAKLGLEVFEISEENQSITKVNPLHLLERRNPAFEDSTNLLCKRESEAISVAEAQVANEPFNAQSAQLALGK